MLLGFELPIDRVSREDILDRRDGVEHGGAHRAGQGRRQTTEGLHRQTAAVRFVSKSNTHKTVKIFYTSVSKKTSQQPKRTHISPVTSSLKKFGPRLRVDKLM